MFLTLCAGLVIRLSKVVPEGMFDQLSSLSFHALLPCLLFSNIYSTDLSTAVQPDLLLYLALWLLGWFLLCYFLYTRAEPDHRRRGAYIQNAFRTNIAVVGVSLAQQMMDGDGVALLSMAIGIMVPMYNVMAVVTLETCRGERVDLKKTLAGILHNPLILSCLLGLVCLFLGARLPSSVETAVTSLGNAGSVTTLIALGASFRLDGLLKNWKPVLFGVLIRLVIAPACAVVPAILMGFRGGALGTVLVCIASPTASTSYPMALACGSDHQLTAQLIVTTSLLCSLTLFLWIFLLKQLALL